MNATKTKVAVLVAGLIQSLAICAYADAPTPPASDIAAQADTVAPVAKPLPGKARKSASHLTQPIDPLEVDARAAIKVTPPSEILLPGVLKIDGVNKNALDFTRARIVEMNNGGSTTVYLSATEPNLIKLPFPNPRVISTDAIKVDKRDVSNNVYINFLLANPKPVQIFLEPQSGSVVLGLQLVPKRIPAQTIIVDDVAAEGTPKPLKGTSEHITWTQSLMETIALGTTPNGYSVLDIPSPPIALNGFLVEPLKKLSNREGDIYIYQVTNPGPAPIALKESEFDGDLVEAVSIYPKPLLKAGEKTRVLVMVGKAKPTPALYRNQ